MAITFERKTEEELQKEQKESRLIPKDTIMDFVIIDEVTFGSKTYKTEERFSSDGKPQLLLIVQLIDSNGDVKTTIRDYITIGSFYANFKLNRLASLAGIKNGELTADSLINLMGKCKVGISKSNDPQYPDKNSIAEYLSGATSKEINSAKEELDDDIPL